MAHQVSRESQVNLIRSSPKQWNRESGDSKVITGITLQGVKLERRGFQIDKTKRRGFRVSRAI